MTDDDKNYCQSNFYLPFHDAILDILRARNALTFVVAWDNTAHYEIGNNNSGQPVVMKPLILSNRGQEDSATALPESQPAAILYF